MTRMLEIKMRVLLDTDEQGDDLMMGLQGLDDENLFPTGAAIERNWVEVKTG
jgi:hypothetical protein|tara:strand:- start:817 stop:972 length:156 start_codon:yes stop_codon:yes gene_type:complete